MALLYFETFNKYATGATGWTDLTNDNPDYTVGGAGPTITASQGRNGENVASYGVVAGRDITAPYASVATGNTVIMAALIRISSAGEFNQLSMELFAGYTTAGGATRNFSVSITRTGQIVITDAGLSPVAFSHAVLVSDQWHVVEIKCLMENAGTIEVRVDGATVISHSGDFLAGATGPRDYIRFFDGITSCDVQWMLAMDTSGSYMNDFIGDLAISEVVPDADGATAAAWTASAGSNYQCVDDALGAYNDDTDYISSSTVNQDNYVSMTGVTLTGLNTVKFTFHTALVRNNGSGSIALLTENNAAVNASADKTLTTSYAWKRKVDYLDPNTAAVWANAAAIDAAEWGVRYR